MSLAQTNPEPNDFKRDCISRFRREYAAALGDAEISVAHTATEGWQKLFNQHRAEEKEDRRKLADRLKGLATSLEDHGLNEDQEKEIGEIKKASAELRDHERVFEVKAIGPVIQAVRECERIILQAKNEASREEHSAPLQNAGLEELMRLEVGKVKHPAWNNETGQVTIEAA